MFWYRHEAGYCSSSSDTESDSSEDEDEGVTVVTINGKRLSADEAARRLGNIQIGSGRCLVVAGRRHKTHHKHHHKESKRDRSKDKHDHDNYFDPKLIASKEDFDVVATEIGKHWKKLARELGLSRGIIEAVSIDFSAEGSYEQAYQALRKWSQKHGSSARLSDLVNALREIGREEIIIRLGKGKR